MKLLIVTREEKADKRYGLGKSITPLVELFRQRGHDVEYLSTETLGPRSLIWRDRISRLLIRAFKPWCRYTDIHALVPGIIERITMGRFAAGLAKKGGFTHVHCHDPFIATGFRWSSFFMRHRSRWGVSEHGFGCYVQAFIDEGIPVGKHVNAFLHKRERNVLKRAHWVVAPTRASLLQLQRDLGVYPAPSHWHAIAHPPTTLSHYDRDNARRQLGIGEELLIIGVGRLIPLKRFDLLIRVFARLKDSQPAMQLRILGEGDTAPLLELARELEIEERVTLTATDDIGLYYSAADIYVSCSQTESFGMANLEALCFGVASVCTAVGGVPEVVGSGATLVAVDDEGSLLNRLSGLVHPRRRSEAAGQALARSLAWPSPESLTTAWLEVYQGVPNSIMIIPEQRPRSTVYAEEPLSLLPLPTALSLENVGRVLVIAPHPDDEILSCGGTVALLRRNGSHVKVVVVTDGGAGDPDGTADGDIVETRRAECQRALAVLGVEDIVFLQEKDTGVENSPEIREQLRGLVSDFGPDWIFSPAPLDLHRDHVNVSLATIHAWQSLGFPARLFAYETWCALPVNRLVDITSVRELREASARCYETPLKYCDYVEAFNGLARYRSLYIEKSHGQDAETFLEILPLQSVEVTDNLLSLRKYQEL
ncbi:MAG: PIG-L family deacetylase [Pseudohongiellaceae bacterium]